MATILFFDFNISDTEVAAAKRAAAARGEDLIVYPTGGMSASVRAKYLMLKREAEEALERSTRFKLDKNTTAAGYVSYMPETPVISDRSCW